MKLIGVTGKAGAGKTTFSNMLAQKSNIGVIHIDDILREMKLKYFKLFMDKNKEGEKTKVNSKLKSILYGNKILFNLFMKFRAELIEKPLQQNIDSLIKEGKEIILIDDIFIKYHNIYKEFSKVFIIRRPYRERQQAVKERDNLTKKEIVAADMAHHKENYKEIQISKNVEVINNDGTQDELANSVNKIYEQQFLNISFREKYKQNDLGNEYIQKNPKTNTNKRAKNEKESR